MNKFFKRQDVLMFVFVLTFGLLMCCGLKVLEKKSVVWASKYNERIK